MTSLSRKIAILICAVAIPAASGQPPRSVVFSGREYIAFPIPSKRPFTELGSYRVEFRIDGFARRDTPQAIYFTHPHSCYIRVNGSLVCTDTASNSLEAGVDLSSRHDIRVRLQRNLSERVWTLEVWNSDGSDYVAITKPLPPSAGIINAAVGTEGHIGAGPGWNNIWEHYTGAVSFFRWYSTLVPRGSVMPLDADGTRADLLDLEFENSVSDSSGRNLNGDIASGPVTYSDSPAYPPTPVYSGPPGVRAGDTAMLDARASIATFADGGMRTVRWEWLSGPARLDFSPPVGARTATVFPVAGNYKVRLTVEDKAGQISSREVEIGAIATAESGVVIQPDPRIAFLMRPMTRWGLSPWRFFDIVDRAAADHLGPATAQDTATFDSFAIKQPGTVSIVPGSHDPVRITGTGTQFRTTFACGGSVTLAEPAPADATTLTLSEGGGEILKAFDTFIVRSPFALQTIVVSEGGTVATVTAQTEHGLADRNVVTIRNLSAIAGISDLNEKPREVTVVDPLSFTVPLNGIGNYSDGTYDVSTSTAAVEERMRVESISGDTVTVTRAYGASPSGYQVAHRAASEVAGVASIILHWKTPDGGTGNAFAGVASCSSDSEAVLALSYAPMREEWAQDIEYSRVNESQISALTYYGYGSVGGSWNWNYYDNVLAFYRLYHRTGLTKYRDYARSLADKWWIFPLDGGYGTPHPRVSGLLGLMLRAMDGRPEMWSGIARYADAGHNIWLAPTSYAVQSSPDTVYDPREQGYALWFAAALAKLHPDEAIRDDAYKKVVDAVLNFWLPRQREDGGFLTVQNDYKGNRAAQPFMHGLVGNSLSFAYEVMKEREHPRSAEVLAMIVKVGEWLWNTRRIETGRGLYYMVHAQDCPAAGGGHKPCEVNSAGVSYYPPESEAKEVESRSLLNTVHGFYGWLLHATGDEVWRERGDYWFGSAFGGPEDGPGTNSPPSGPHADGVVGEFANATPPCSQSAPPCGGSGPWAKSAKDWAMAAGVGYAAAYLGFRAGGEQPAESQDVLVNFDLASHPGASQVRITVTQPCGRQTQAVCSSSPCRIAVDPRQGNHLRKLEYLSATGDVIVPVDEGLLSVTR